MRGFCYRGGTQAALAKGPDSGRCLSEVPPGDHDEVSETQLDQSRFFETFSGR